MTVQEKDRWRTFLRLFLSEAAGTALLLLIGLSLVIVMSALAVPWYVSCRARDGGR
jgi:hypothetical protein